MTIFDLTFSDLWNNLLPVRKRLAKFMALGSVLLYPLQWLHDLFFTDYIGGAVYSNYDNTTTYAIGDRAIYLDRAVYECIAPSTGNVCTDQSFWIVRQGIFLGLHQRTRANAQVIVYEGLLNEWFQVPPPSSPQIYIVTNSAENNFFKIGITPSESSGIPLNPIDAIDGIGYAPAVVVYNFTIFVPTAIWTPLAASDPVREAIIRSVADIYNLAGRNYNVTTY